MKNVLRMMLIALTMGAVAAALLLRGLLALTGLGVRMIGRMASRIN